MNTIYGTGYFPSHGDALLYYAAQYNCSIVDISSTVKLKLEDGEIHIGEPPLPNEGDRRELFADNGGSRRWSVIEGGKVSHLERAYLRQKEAEGLESMAARNINLPPLEGGS